MAVNIKEISKTLPILKCSHTPEPMWHKDSGRNSNSGKWTGTFAGYFSQLKIDLVKLIKYKWQK